MFFLLDIIGHENDHIPQCEYCDEFMVGPKFDEPITGPETGWSVFCSEDCLRDALEDMRIGRCEAASEYEMYGNDFDSWYR